MAGFKLDSGSQKLTLMLSSHSPNIHILIIAVLIVMNGYTALQGLILQTIFQRAGLITPLYQIKGRTGSGDCMTFTMQIIDFKAGDGSAFKALTDLPTV